MIPGCDHTSVGILVRNEESKLLLLERKLFPFGFASPAGHIDQHGSPEQTARDELREEVGLQATALRLVAEGRKNNKCRRPGGDWHYWYIYEAEASGPLNGSVEETKKVGWNSDEQIRKLATRTELYLAGNLSETDWEESPGLETVCYEWFKELRII